HPLDRADDRRSAALAPHRDHESVSRRTGATGPSRGDRDHHLLRAQLRTALVHLPDGTPLKTLHPAYFALVMATGIVSIAAKLLEVPYVPRALLWINILAFITLWILTILRIARYPKDVFADLIDHQRGVGFFTAVAATSVL